MIIARLQTGQRFLINGAIVAVREVTGSRVVLVVDGVDVVLPNRLSKLPYDPEPTSIEYPETVRIS